MKPYSDEPPTEDRSDRRYTWMCWLLAAVGGFADAGSFILVGSFTGHVTGNALLTAIYLVTGKSLLAVSSAVAVFAFLCGTTTD